MGQYFTNIQIRKNDTVDVNYLKEYLIEHMKKQGFEAVEDASVAEGAVNIYAPKGTNWISICSDLIDFNDAEDSKKFLSPLSERFSTDVLSVGCFDSDYMFIHLINENEKIDGWLNIGRNLEGSLSRRTGYAPWKKRIKEIERLKEIVHEEYVFVEEALEPFGELMDLPLEQSSISERDIRELEDSNDIVSLFFMMKNADIKKELPKLEIPRYSLTPCKEGKDACVFAVNRGGKSKGLGIMIDLVSKDDIDITFKDVCLEYDFDYHGKRTSRPIELEKCQAKDGKWVYWWMDPDFQIPPKVNQNLGMSKISDLEFCRQFGVRFTPYGNARMYLDIRVTFVPLKNAKDGLVLWYVWKSDKSKEKYIEEHNKRWTVFGESGRRNFLNPEDYDL